MVKSLEDRFEAQQQALRDPTSLLVGSWQDLGIDEWSFNFETEGKFVEILEQAKINLVVTREYEHLIMSIGVSAGKLQQCWFPLPHPSGLVIDRQTENLYVMGTRNPNQLWEFGIKQGLWMPSRMKVYPGRYYFHDLVLIKNQLYACSVGLNGIVPVSLAEEMETPVWWPKVLDNKPRKNYLQLNSIAGEDDLASSFFRLQVT